MVVVVAWQPLQQQGGYDGDGGFNCGGVDGGAVASAHSGRGSSMTGALVAAAVWL
jgi:hypothetical protein